MQCAMVFDLVAELGCPPGPGFRRRLAVGSLAAGLLMVMVLLHVEPQHMTTLPNGTDFNDAPSAVAEGGIASSADIGGVGAVVIQQFNTHTPTDWYVAKVWGFPYNRGTYQSPGSAVAGVPLSAADPGSSSHPEGHGQRVPSATVSGKDGAEYGVAVSLGGSPVGSGFAGKVGTPCTRTMTPAPAFVQSNHDDYADNVDVADESYPDEHAYRLVV